MKGHAGNDQDDRRTGGRLHRHGGPGAPRPAVCEGGGPAAGAGGDGGAGLPAKPGGQRPGHQRHGPAFRYHPAHVGELCGRGHGRWRGEVPAGPSGLQCERHHPPVPPGADGGLPAPAGHAGGGGPGDRPVRRGLPPGAPEAGAPGGAADAGGDLQLRHCRRPAAVLRGRGRPPRRPGGRGHRRQVPQARRPDPAGVRRPRLRRTQGPGRRLSGAACGAGAPAGGLPGGRDPRQL